MKKQIIVPAILAGTVICGTLVFTGCGQATVPDVVTVQNAENHVIKVSSKETVMAEPDVADIVYSVYSQATDAQTCQTQNNKDLENVLELLKGQGIDEKYIQTSNYGLNPVYDWENGKSISGYEMTTDVTVASVPIDQVGSLLSDSVDAGINSISSVTYKASKYDENYQEALKKAIEAAEVKANVMAEAGGCAITGISSIEEYSSSQQARTNYAAGGAAKEQMAVADMAVMPGQIEIEASIEVEFSIN